MTIIAIVLCISIAIGGCNSEKRQNETEGESGKPFEIEKLTTLPGNVMDSVAECLAPEIELPPMNLEEYN